MVTWYSYAYFIILPKSKVPNLKIAIVLLTLRNVGLYLALVNYFMVSVIGAVRAQIFGVLKLWSARKPVGGTYLHTTK